MQWYIFAIASAIISGIVPIIDKKILSKTDVSSFSMIYSLSNFLFSLSLLLFIDISIDWYIILLIFIGSLFGTLGFYSINKALKKYEISLVSPLRSFNPIVLFILATLFLGEHLTIYKFTGIILIAIGTYIIEARNILHKPFHPLKLIIKSSLMVLIVSSALFYGVSSMLDKVILSRYDVLGYIILAHFFIMTNFFIFNLVQNKKAFPWNPQIKSVALLIVIASILTLSYRFLLAEAVSLALISIVVPIKHLDSLVATIVGGEMMHEKHLKKKIFAAVVMFIGVLLLIVNF